MRLQSGAVLVDRGSLLPVAALSSEGGRRFVLLHLEENDIVCIVGEAFVSDVVCGSSWRKMPVIITRAGQATVGCFYYSEQSTFDVLLNHIYLNGTLEDGLPAPFEKRFEVLEHNQSLDDV